MQVIKVTSTSSIYTGHASVLGITLVPGSAAATITLDDSTDGAGSDKGGVKTDSSYSREASMYGTMFNTGIYATISGAGAVAYVYIK